MLSKVLKKILGKDKDEKSEIFKDEKMTGRKLQLLIDETAKYLELIKGCKERGMSQDVISLLESAAKEPGNNYTSKMD